jgi:hypothetical protein
VPVEAKSLGRAEQMESNLPIHGILLGFPQQRNRSGKGRERVDSPLSAVNKRLN